MSKAGMIVDPRAVFFEGCFDQVWDPAYANAEGVGQVWAPRSLRRLGGQYARPITLMATNDGVRLAWGENLLLGHARAVMICIDYQITWCVGWGGWGVGGGLDTPRTTVDVCHRPQLAP